LWSRESDLIWGVFLGEFKPIISNVLALVHAEEQVLVRQTLAADSDSTSVDVRVFAGGDSERRMHAVVNRVMHENGSPLRLHGIYHDVTSHRLAEGKPQRQDRKFQPLFDNSAVCP
jgi:hypothetical protein